jgi:outer membrane protein OmpA-like peptidoglycan-associated protein
MREREEELKQKYGTSMADAKVKEENQLLEDKVKALELAAAVPVAAAPSAPIAKAEIAKKTEIKKELEATKKAIAAKQVEAAKKTATPTTPNNQIWFIPNDSQLTPIQQGRLKSVIAFLKSHPEMTIELKPFIEPSMKDPDLPYTRADVVKNYLINQGGLDINRIQVVLAGTGSMQVGKRWVSGRRIDVRFLVQ